MHFDRVAFDLAEDVLEVIGVEADLERVGAVVGGDFLGRGAVVGAGDRQGDLVLLEPHLDRAGLLGGDRRHAVDTLVERLWIELEELVVTRWNNARIIGECAVDQLAGQDHPALAAEREADLARAEVDLDVGVERFLEQLPELADGLPRNDHVGHPLGALGTRDGEAREPVAVGRSGLEHRLVVIGNVQEDAVQVVAGFLGRDRETRAVDQLGERTRR